MSARDVSLCLQASGICSAEPRGALILTAQGIAPPFRPQKIQVQGSVVLLLTCQGKETEQLRGPLSHGELRWVHLIEATQEQRPYSMVPASHPGSADGRSVPLSMFDHPLGSGANYPAVQGRLVVRMAVQPDLVRFILAAAELPPGCTARGLRFHLALHLYGVAQP